VIGCCGWSYQDWLGVFYPADAAPADSLALYAQAFPSVEVDSTFYGPPTESTVRQWDARTPEGFRFALKVPRIVTHEKRLRDAGGDFEEFVATTALLGPKRGPLLMQFPRFSRADFEGPSEFVDLLGRFLGGVDRGLRLAVEVRNTGWLDDPLFDLLRDHAVALAVTDQAGGPPRHERGRWMTADFAYIRLLGDRRRIETITKTWGETVIDRTAELARWAGFIRGLHEGAPDVAVWVYANNHYSGHAPAAARRLAAMLDAGA
jgi:uncharacterized protein YecE (DUF72 family)